jgi:hypothetical protein
VSIRLKWWVGIALVIIALAAFEASLGVTSPSPIGI